MIINSPTFEKLNEEQIRISYNLKAENFQHNLWYEVNKKYENFLSKSCDAALVALIIPAMYAGEDIYINGTISEKLLFNSFRLQKLLQIVIPSLKIINITSKETTVFKSDSTFVASSFSGGVDSFTTLNDYFYNCNYDHHKITHLTYHNVGNHVIGAFDTPFHKQNDLFNRRFDRLKKVVSKLGEERIPFIKIDSNLDTFYNSNALNFEQTFTLRNISPLLLLQQGITKYYLSSGVSYDFVKVKKSLSTSVIDSILLPLLSTESIELMSTGSEYSRVEKTLIIANLEVAKTSLDVCIDSIDGKNCSKCFKCMRTQFTLDLSGKLTEFSNVFDLDVYQLNKKSYARNLILGFGPISSEIIQYAREIGENLGSIDINDLIDLDELANKLNQLRIQTLVKEVEFYRNRNDVKNTADLCRLVLAIDPTHPVGDILFKLEQMFRT